MHRCLVFPALANWDASTMKMVRLIQKKTLLLFTNRSGLKVELCHLPPFRMLLLINCFFLSFLVEEDMLTTFASINISEVFCKKCRFVDTRSGVVLLDQSNGKDSDSPRKSMANLSLEHWQKML